VLREKEMEDAIASDPGHYIEDGLTLVARQHRVGSYVFDLLFEGRHHSKLIVEIQKGVIDRAHTYKVLDYFDEFKTRNPEEFIEVMIIANEMPPERKRRLSSYGIAFKEIPVENFPPPPSSQERTPPPEPPSDKEGLADVESWLRSYISSLPMGHTDKIGTAARRSRKIAHILPKGNAEGVRYLMGKLSAEGCVELMDKLNFKVLKGKQ
jgi:hypothetical protein